MRLPGTTEWRDEDDGCFPSVLCLEVGFMREDLGIKQESEMNFAHWNAILGGVGEAAGGSRGWIDGCDAMVLKQNEEAKWCGQFKREELCTEGRLWKAGKPLHDSSR